SNRRRSVPRSRQEAFPRAADTRRNRQNWQQRRWPIAPSTMERESCSFCDHKYLEPGAGIFCSVLRPELAAIKNRQQSAGDALSRLRMESKKQCFLSCLRAESRVHYGEL